MGYETITTQMETGAKLWVARKDGEKISREEFEVLNRSMIKEQGGPAHMTFKLQCNHWDEVEPISIVPEKYNWEGRTHHCIWEDVMACAEAARKIDAVIFGHFHVNEKVDGFWVENFKFQLKKGSPENPEILIARKDWVPFEN